MKTLLLTATIIAMTSLFIPPVYAQAGGAQEESEGDLTVVINGETFTTGQTITIAGSVDEPGTMPPQIEIFDPEGTLVVIDFPNLSADNTFTFSMVAGDNDDPLLMAEGPMNIGGNYRVTVTFFASFTNMDVVDMEFEYIVTPAPEVEEQSDDNAAVGGQEGVLGGIFGGAQQESTPPTTPTISKPLNATALRDLVAQGQEQFQALNTVLIRANVSDSVLEDLNSIQVTFQEIRRQLDGVAAGTQVIQ